MGVSAFPLSTSSNYPSFVNSALTAAKTSWLKNEQLMAMLQHFRDCPGGAVSGAPPQLPEGGNLYLVDKTQCRAYRDDGHVWEKKPDGRTLKENHEKLKVGLDYMLNCYYSYVQQRAGEENEHPLNRRIYWLLENEDLVLVHYLHSPRKAQTRGRKRPAAGPKAAALTVKKQRAGGSGGGSSVSVSASPKKQRSSSSRPVVEEAPTISTQSEQSQVAQEELSEEPSPQSRPAEQPVPPKPELNEEEEELLLNFGTIGSGSLEPWLSSSVHEGEAATQQAGAPSSTADPGRALTHNTSWRRREEEVAARAKAPVRLLSHDWSLPEPCTPGCCALAMPAQGLEQQGSISRGSCGSSSSELLRRDSLLDAWAQPQLASGHECCGDDGLTLAWHDSFMSGIDDSLGFGLEVPLDSTGWAGLAPSEEEGAAGLAAREAPRAGAAMWHLAGGKVRALCRLRAFLEERAHSQAANPQVPSSAPPTPGTAAPGAALRAFHALPAHR